MKIPFIITGFFALGYIALARHDGIDQSQLKSVIRSILTSHWDQLQL